MAYPLAIQNYIHKYGVEKTVRDFKLQFKDLGHKMMFKYHQTHSEPHLQEVREARGLVLEKNTLKIMSFPFKRFYDYDDYLSPKIDWDTAIAFEKRAGSSIQIYYDLILNSWQINTMFSECKESLYLDRQPTVNTFETLVKDIILKHNSSFDLFEIGYTYIFELTSPFNKDVVTYGFPEMYLLAVRNLETLEEESYMQLHNYFSKNIKLPLVKKYEYSSLQECLNSFNNMNHNFEGYVVCDENFNRIKVKNPAYNVVKKSYSHKTNEIETSRPQNLIPIVLQGDSAIELFVNEFPNSKPIINKLYVNYRNLVFKMNYIVPLLYQPKNITSTEKKIFGDKLQELLIKQGFSESIRTKIFGSYYSLLTGKIKSIDQWLNGLSKEKLYELIK